MLDAGDVVLITGATGGIGRRIAARATAAGAVVGVHGSRPETVATVVDDLGGVPVVADFREPGAVGAAVESLVRRTGRLDAVIHCAVTGAPGVTGLLADTRPENYGAAADLLLGTFQRLCFAARPHLAERGGAIVGLISDAGVFAAPHQAILGGAFGGIAAFARNLAVEVSREGIRVNVLSLSYVQDTPVFERRATQGRAQTAAQRAGLGLPTPDDVAPMALFLCSPGAAKITGQVISINGGLNA